MTLKEQAERLKELAQGQRERPALQVVLGRTVFVARAECQREVPLHTPFVLPEEAEVVTADVAGRHAELKDLVGKA